MVENVAVINENRSSHVAWGAIFAGALVAAAVSFLLLAFGAAVGLSVVSPWSGRGADASTFGLLAAAWFLVVCASSYWIGGFLAGRLRRSWADLTVDEVHRRDGFHGVVVWAIGVIIFIQLGVSAAVSLATGAAATSPELKASAQEYVLDDLFRAGPDAGRSQAWDPEHRVQASRILTRSAVAKKLSADDRSYLVEVVAYETGLSREDAARRVDTAIANTKENVDAARKNAVLGGFLSIASLLVGAVAAWMGAVRGGKTRDLQSVRVA